MDLARLFHDYLDRHDWLVPQTGEFIASELGKAFAAADAAAVVSWKDGDNGQVGLLCVGAGWTLVSLERPQNEAAAVDRTHTRTTSFGTLSGVSLTEVRLYGTADAPEPWYVIEALELRHKRFPANPLVVDLMRHRPEEHDEIRRAFSAAAGVAI